MTRADLDAVEARAAAALADDWCNTPFCSVAPGAHPRQAGCPGTPQQWDHYRGMDPATTLDLAAELRAARAEHELVRENVKQWIGKLERAGFRDGVLAVTMRAFLDEHLAARDA